MVRSSGQTHGQQPIHLPHDVTLKQSSPVNKTFLGNAPVETTLPTETATLSASLFFRATATVAKSTTIRTYHFPLSDSGEIGPCKSTAAPQNRTSIRVS